MWNLMSMYSCRYPLQKMPKNTNSLFLQQIEQHLNLDGWSLKDAPLGVNATSLMLIKFQSGISTLFLFVCYDGRKHPDLIRVFIVVFVIVSRRYSLFSLFSFSSARRRHFRHHCRHSFPPITKDLCLSTIAPYWSTHAIQVKAFFLFWQKRC